MYLCDVGEDRSAFESCGESRDLLAAQSISVDECADFVGGQ